MPSFLSKVFGRKKDDKDHVQSKRHSGTSLLEGKFEAISPNVSPSAAHFSESLPPAKGREKDKDTPFSLFRPRSRQPPSPTPSAAKSSTITPLLSLNLSEAKEEKDEPIFEADPYDRSVLPDSAIGERRINPLEALSLVKACSNAIVDRGGLETLGVMRPHWYSASPDVQRKLISLFILSLTSKGQTSTLPPSSSPSHLFESELSYTRSPHDIAAVLRWGLRHLQLDGNSFAKDVSADATNEEAWRWYFAFADAERSLSYPPDAFSKSLTPQLPTAHQQLLIATLDIISSLAAHAETNGSSGSKLTKLFGLWLLTAQRTQESDDWPAFYARWEHAGRIFEHIYLSYIRDDASHEKMPVRLVELVKHYPYEKTPSEDRLLARPRFSTRRFDTLYVRLETQLPDKRSPRPKSHPIRLVQDALKAEIDSGAGEYAPLWEQIRKGASENGDNSNAFAISRIFDEDTLNLFSLVPLEESSPTIRISPPSARPMRRRSTSVGGAATANGNGNGNGKASTANGVSPGVPTSRSSPTDWVDFSSTGFGDSSLGKDFAATLLDSDVEKTMPPDTSRESGKKRRATSPTIPSPGNRRSSSESPQSPANRGPDAETRGTIDAKAKVSKISLIHIDEAFIDFWSDAFTDPIASSWPAFVVCKVKPSVGLIANEKPLNWLVIEHGYTYPSLPPPAEPSAVKRASSPRPSLRSNRKSGTFTAARKRFNLFNSEAKTVTSPAKSLNLTSPGLGGRKKGAKSPRIGEMGEILPEVDEGTSEPKSIESVQPTRGTGLGITPDASAIPPRDEKSPSDLPPVPLVDAAPAAETNPVSTEPVEVDEEKERPTIPLSSDVRAPADVAAENEPASAPTLPPAPEPVVLSGGTPGPQVALDSSEPIALAEASQPEAPVDSVPGEQAAVAQPPVEPALVNADLESAGIIQEPKSLTAEDSAFTVAEQTAKTEESEASEPAVSTAIASTEESPSTAQKDQSTLDPEPTSASTAAQVDADALPEAKAEEVEAAKAETHEIAKAPLVGGKDGVPDPEIIDAANPHEEAKQLENVTGQTVTSAQPELNQTDDTSVGPAAIHENGVLEKSAPSAKNEPEGNGQSIPTKAEEQSHQKSEETTSVPQA